MPQNPSPVSYYGGKVQLLNEILPRIPEHSVFCEPFFGSGVVFFAKSPAEGEIINDQNNLVINFYQEVKSNFSELKALVEATLFSRSSHSVAGVIWRNPTLFNKVQRAWAFYVGCNMGFAGQANGSWGYDRFGKRALGFLNKKMRFDQSFADRLEKVTIECKDAVDVINTYDSPSCFFYVDPPYPETHQGHYDKYSMADFELLLATLSKIKGKFLLSSYPNAVLDRFIEVNGWYSVSFEKAVSAKKVLGGKKPRKVEVLTANYPIS